MGRRACCVTRPFSCTSERPSQTRRHCRTCDHLTGTAQGPQPLLPTMRVTSACCSQRAGPSLQSQAASSTSSRLRARHAPQCRSGGTPPPLPPPCLSRAQVLKGGLLATGGLLLGAAAPGQTLAAQPAAAEALAPAAGSAAPAATSVAAQQFSKVRGAGPGLHAARPCAACAAAHEPRLGRIDDTGYCRHQRCREAAAPPGRAPPNSPPPSPAALSHPAAQVLLNTLSDCQLAVSVYPTFAYNAAGGGGAGTVRQGADGLLHVTFDPASL